MSVRRGAGDVIHLEGECPGEDADALLQQLLSVPGACVDWRACESLHSAVLQVLMASGCRLLGPPAGPALRQWIEPVLSAPKP